MATLWSRTAEDLPQEKEIVPVPLGRACLERAMVIAEMLLMPPTEMEGVNIGATNADGDTALDLARAAGNYLHKLAAAIAPVAIKHLRDAAGLKPDELSVLFKNFPVERVLQEDLRRVMDACGSHSVPKVMIRRVAALRQVSRRGKRVSVSPRRGNRGAR